MKKIYIDTETTGLFAHKSSIHQFAAIVEIDGEAVDRLVLKALPREEDKIDMKALEVSGITLQDIQDRRTRITQEDLLTRIVSLLDRYIDKFDKKDKFFFLGYNAKFDEEFLRQLFLKGGNKFFGSYFWTPSICVMQKAAVKLMNENKRHLLQDMKLQTVMKEFVPTFTGNFHDAETDIEATRILDKVLCGY